MTIRLNSSASLRGKLILLHLSCSWIGSAFVSHIRLGMAVLFTLMNHRLGRRRASDAYCICCKAPDARGLHRFRRALPARSALDPEHVSFRTWSRPRYGGQRSPHNWLVRRSPDLWKLHALL